MSDKDDLGGQKRRWYQRPRPGLSNSAPSSRPARRPGDAGLPVGPTWDDDELWDDEPLAAPTTPRAQEPGGDPWVDDPWADDEWAQPAQPPSRAAQPPAAAAPPKPAPAPRPAAAAPAPRPKAAADPEQERIDAWLSSDADSFADSTREIVGRWADPDHVAVAPAAPAARTSTTPTPGATWPDEEDDEILEVAAAPAHEVEAEPVLAAAPPVEVEEIAEPELEPAPELEPEPVLAAAPVVEPTVEPVEHVEPVAPVVEPAAAAAAVAVEPEPALPSVTTLPVGERREHPSTWSRPAASAPETGADDVIDIREPEVAEVPSPAELAEPRLFVPEPVATAAAAPAARTARPSAPAVPAAAADVPAAPAAPRRAPAPVAAEDGAPRPAARRAAPAPAAPAPPAPPAPAAAAGPKPRPSAPPAAPSAPPVPAAAAPRPRPAAPAPAAPAPAAKAPSRPAPAPAPVASRDVADDFDDEWDDRPPTRGTGRGAAPLPPVALETDFDDDDFDDEYDDDYSDDYDDDRIPVAAMSGDGLAAGRGWGSTAVTAATWLVILAAGAQILAIASGAAEAKVAGFDVLHRIGDGFAALGPWQALLLLFGVLVVAAPRLFGSRDNGSARAAGSAFGIAIPSGIVGVAGALLAFRYQLRQIDLAGNGTDLADVLRLGAQLVAAAGTSLVAFGAGLLSLRAASND